MILNENSEWINNQMKKLTFLVGNEEILHNITNVAVLPSFSEIVINFLNDLSKNLRKNYKSKEMLDVLSYAYWIRKASLQKEKENHLNIEKRIGRGVTYHIAPSNVPVNFAVSMTSALLAGNACVIRVSNKSFEQVDVICNAIRELLEGDYNGMRGYLCVIRYEHDEEITQMLTSICDVRIIWGGDRTISLIRKAELPSRAIEMAFSDRYSIAIIDADEYLKMNPDKVAESFYIDTYYSDQNACSSPRLIVWLGKNKKEAKKLFWAKLKELAIQKYDLSPIQAIDKLTASCLLTADCMKNNGIEIKVNIEDNYLFRVEIDKIDAKIMKYKEGGGYFFEYSADCIDEIIPIFEKKCQTVAVLGIETSSICELVKKYGVYGVDRVVPIGKTMELSFRWDGYDMIETMSRIIWEEK